MKTLYKIHVATAIIGWVFIVIASISVLPEGSLVAIASLCLLAASTAITAVDLLSVYFVGKGKAKVLPVISLAFWGIIFVIYSIGLFKSGEPWQSRIVSGVLVLTALFKIYTTAKMVIE